MLFGNTLRELRTQANISINELGKVAEISPSYISKLENNPEKIPSKEMIIKIAYAIRRLDKSEQKISDGYMEILEKLLKSENLNFDTKERVTIFYKDFPDYLKERNNKTTRLITKRLDDDFNNRFAISRKNGNVNYLDMPYFDLEWLLSQEKFYLMYGRNLMINEEIVKEHDKYEFHNILNLEDITIIREIIKAYFTSKYEPIINSREIFEHEIRKKSETFQLNKILEIYNDEKIKLDDRLAIISELLNKHCSDDLKQRVSAILNHKFED